MTLQEAIFVYPFIIAILGLIGLGVHEYDRMKAEEEQASEQSKPPKLELGGLSGKEMDDALRQALKADGERDKRINGEGQKKRKYRRPCHYDFS